MPEAKTKKAHKRVVLADKPLNRKNLLRKFPKLIAEISNPTLAHDLWATFMGYLPNPDPLIEITNHENICAFYDSMVDSDSNLSGLINTRIHAVTGLDWSVVSASEETRDVEIAEFVEGMLLNIYEFEDDLEELLGALRTGYAISEIIWERVDNRIVVTELKSRRPDRFVFNPDYELLLRTKANYWGEPLPPNKFVVHRNSKRYENPYGVSVCRAVYWMWKFKHEGMRWWVIAVERNAVPTPFGKYPRDWDPDQQDAFYNALIGFMSDNAITCQEDADITFIETKTDPQLNEKLRDACNEEMAWGIIGSSHATGTGSKGSGSFALAKEHGTVRHDILESDSKRLMATLNKQLIETAVLLNFGPQKAYPRFKLHFEPPSDRTVEADIITKAVKMGIPVDQIKAAELMGVPLAEDESQAIVLPPVQSPFGDLGFADNEKKKTSGNVTAAQSKMIENIRRLDEAATQFGEIPLLETLDEYPRWLAQQTVFAQALNETRTWTFDRDKLAKAIETVMVWAFLWGYHEVFDELGFPVLPKRKLWSLFQKPKQREFSTATYKPLPPKEAIEIFSRRDVLTREQFDTLIEELRREAFTAANISLDNLEKLLYPAMQDALMEGLTLPEFREQVRDLLLSNAHTETIFRTNLMSAYNSGHADSFFDPLVSDMIPAFEFTAILDGRTTEICRIMDGRIIYKGEMLSSPIVPPLHFNCRSTVIPIFTYQLDESRVTNLPDILNDPEAPHPGPGFGYWQPVINKPGG